MFLCELDTGERFSFLEPSLHKLSVNLQRLPRSAGCEPYVGLGVLTGRRIYQCCLPCLRNRSRSARRPSV